MTRTVIRARDTVSDTVTLYSGDALINRGMLDARDDPAVVLAEGNAAIYNRGEIHAGVYGGIVGTLSGHLDLRIINTGYIQTQGTSILLASDETSTGDVRIVNSGEINGEFSGGIDLAGLHADRVFINNSGTLSAINATNVIDGSAGRDIVLNSGHIEGAVALGTGDDRFVNTGAFYGPIDGGAGDDRISAGDGNTTIIGGAGRDVLIGGDGSDNFRFDDLSASAADPARADRIADFDKSEGDAINLSKIDADTTSDGNQAFAFIGVSEFSGTAGELRAELHVHRTVIYADVDGDRIPDFSLVLADVSSTEALQFLL